VQATFEVGLLPVLGNLISNLRPPENEPEAEKLACVLAVTAPLRLGRLLDLISQVIAISGDQALLRKQ
jgi:hypothetical protein